jgi:hypothetical protein
MAGQKAEASTTPPPRPNFRKQTARAARLSGHCDGISSIDRRSHRQRRHGRPWLTPAVNPCSERSRTRRHSKCPYSRRWCHPVQRRGRPDQPVAAGGSMAYSWTGMGAQRVPAAGMICPTCGSSSGVRDDFWAEDNYASHKHHKVKESVRGIAALAFMSRRPRHHG